MIELSDRPADMMVRKLRKESRNPELSPDHAQLMNRAADMVNALDILSYQCVVACKRMGFVYDDTVRESEFHQAFFWLQEKGAAAHEATLADSKYQMVLGVEQRVNELYKFFQENKNGQG
ncbi:hypothetical protein pEaSNUABM56_00056 [Erwinia phage pEa_SNUABM_56]|uniref:Uncharacterized protein n=1 Tax=Erwinia phage pEp_SNUABM_01 TaxID=2601643 RepID=A0A5J6DBF0_9CAUD|nr:hypothetical protein HWC63_gp030 [Erwinia phage pEp_SNUABM_01]QEQ94856.1 hypothetical protein pEpSNUABM01_030 [Erwinia phage pEp_SNUABM_01]UYL85101.1 hypothetical protein pEaSNUABM56_00056 [Erwinia phage pEa_SNUABM_56]